MDVNIRTDDEIRAVMESISQEKFDYVNTYYKIHFKSYNSITLFTHLVLYEYFNKFTKSRIEYFLQSLSVIGYPVTHTHQSVITYEVMADLKILVEDLKKHSSN